MRTHLKWLIAALVAFLTFTASPSELWSQGLADFQVNVYGGTSFFGTESFSVGPPQSTTPIPFDFEIERGLRTGVRLNLLTAVRWGIEIYYGYESKDASYIRTESGERLDLPIQIHGLGGNLLYYPMGSTELRRIIPFVSGGLGVALFRPTSAAQDIARNPFQADLSPILESNKAAYSYGVGAKYRLNRVFGARFDVRGFLSRVPTFGLPTASPDRNTVVIPLTGHFHNTQVTGGITINFGSR